MTFDGLESPQRSFKLGYYGPYFVKNVAAVPKCKAMLHIWNEPV